MKLTKRDISQLKKLVEYAKRAYYNTDRLYRAPVDKLTDNVATILRFGKLVLGEPVLPGAAKSVMVKAIEISDAVYDLVEKVIEQHDGDWSPTVGAPVTGKTKVKLPYPMGSLDKARPGEGSVAKFAAKNRGPYMVSDKLDGLSIAVVYDYPNPVKAYTRGDGIIGQDISFLVPHLRLPEYRGKLALRGEAIMSKGKFAGEWSKLFKNPRNLASGVLNRKGVHEAIKDIDVVFYEVLSPAGVPSAQLAKLKSNGFGVVPHKVVPKLTDAALSNMLRMRRAKTKYEIDGLVIMQDKRNTRPTAGNPEYGIAFKEESGENLAQTKVIRVEWNASRHRMLKPRIEVEPVELSGVTVTWATGHNAKNIWDNRIGPGAVIELTRSGEVIPYVKRVVRPARKPQMPDVPYEWNATEVDILLPEDHKSTDVEVKRIYNFLSAGLGVEHLAAGLIARMYEHGIDSIEKFLRATPEDFLRVRGIKETMANKVYAQIQKGIKSADLARVAANSGMFGRNFGDKRMAQILSKFDLYELAVLPQTAVKSEIMSLRGFQETTAAQFAENLRAFIRWVKKLPLRFVERQAVKQVGAKLAKHVVAFTGFRDAALEEAIVGQGGTVANAVSKTTTILVVKDVSSGSSKVQKARQLGLEIYTPAEFKRKYRI